MIELFCPWVLVFVKSLDYGGGLPYRIDKISLACDVSMRNRWKNSPLVGHPLHIFSMACFLPPYLLTYSVYHPLLPSLLFYFFFLLLSYSCYFSSLFRLFLLPSSSSCVIFLLYFLFFLSFPCNTYCLPPPPPLSIIPVLISFILLYRLGYGLDGLRFESWLGQ